MTCIHSPTVEAVLLVSVATIAALHTGIWSLLVSTHATIIVVALTTIGIIAAHLATISTVGTSHAAIASHSTVHTLDLAVRILVTWHLEARVGILVSRASVEARARLIQWGIGLLHVLFLLFGGMWVFIISKRAARDRVHVTYLREMD